MKIHRVWISWLLCALALPLVAQGQQFSSWSAPVNLGPTVNTASAEVNPAISKDGLSLYFGCQACPGGYGGFDIYVSHRTSVSDPWGPPQNLGPTINTPFNDTNPYLSLDEHQLFFTSNKPGGFGGVDIYVSRRHNKTDDLDWRTPENLGGGVNSSSNDRHPTIFEDEATGAITMYFSSDRPGGAGREDVYMSTLQPDETFGPAAPVLELNTSSDDRNPQLRQDGLELFFDSDRPGTLGGNDLWVATRTSTSEPWSPPVNIGPVVNSLFSDVSPSLSFDGTTLYFNSANRPGNITPAFDLWVTTRSKLPGPEDQP